MNVALRVLKAITGLHEPNPDDVSKLRQWVPSEEFNNPPDELARATVERELEKKNPAGG